MHNTKLIDYFHLSHYSETASAFPYCTEPGLNFSATNYSEDDADFAAGRRGKASRVSHNYFKFNFTVCRFSLREIFVRFYIFFKVSN